MKWFFLLFIFVSKVCYGVDNFNPTNNTLSIPIVLVGHTSYINVEVSVGQIISIGGSTVSAVDIYQPTNNQLFISSVQVGPKVYKNVIITVGNVLKVGGVGATTISNTQLLATNINLGLPGSSKNIVQVFGVADLNNDGLEDVVISGFPEPPNPQGSELVQLRIFIQNPDGTLTDRTSSLLPNNSIEGATRIQIADIDKDGYPDIFLQPGQDSTWAHMYIFWGSSQGFIRDQLPNYYMMGACLGDFNQDGLPDLLVLGTLAGKNFGTANILINNGNRTFNTININSITGGDSCATIKYLNNNFIYVSNENINNQFGDYIYQINSQLNLINPPVNIYSSGGYGTNYTVQVSSVPSIYNTGLNDFVIMRDQNLGGVDGVGPKSIMINNGNGTFTDTGVIYTSNSGPGDVVPLLINSEPSLFFYGTGSTSSIFVGNNQLKTSIFDDMSQYFGPTTAYENLNTQTVYILENRNGWYIKPLQ